MSQELQGGAQGWGGRGFPWLSAHEAAAPSFTKHLGEQLGTSRDGDGWATALSRGIQSLDGNSHAQVCSLGS